MKSHARAGQFKLRGKKEKFLSCGCCVVRDLREDHEKRNARKDIAYALEDVLTQEEYWAGYCTAEDPCPMCKDAAERLRSNISVTGHGAGEDQDD